TEVNDLFSSDNPEVLELWTHLWPWVERLAPYSELYQASYPDDLD
ncbi:MAG: hypothetical protein GWP91_16000, partial [Rhodobacterales bacterium]|nr:hypothetical protein [Rhodobacterales bacterium]